MQPKPCMQALSQETKAQKGGEKRGKDDTVSRMTCKVQLPSVHRKLWRKIRKGVVVLHCTCDTNRGQKKSQKQRLILTASRGKFSSSKQFSKEAKKATVKGTILESRGKNKNKKNLTASSNKACTHVRLDNNRIWEIVRRDDNVKKREN